MIRPYWGEFLYSPMAVHVGFNSCSHNCWYCFANLNKPDRMTDWQTINQVVKQVMNKKKTTGNLASNLLRAGHGICVSNDCDPFANSNLKDFHKFLDAANEMGIKVGIQTKGGKGALDFVKNYPPTMLYVTVTSDIDEYNRIAEPLAYTFEKRVELIQTAMAYGHFVVIGLNPIMPRWWKDIFGFMKGVGCKHFWTGNLHLSNIQIANMPEKIKYQYATEIAEGRKRTGREDVEFTKRVKMFATSHGLNCFEGGISTLGNFWKPYFDLGNPFFPTMDGFFSHMESIAEPPIAFTYGYFDEWAKIDVEPSYGYGSYLNSFGRTIRSKGLKAVANSYSSVYDWYWKLLEFPTPFLKDSIEFMGEQEKNGIVISACAENKDILVYNPDKEKQSESMLCPADKCNAWLEREDFITGRR